MDVSPVLNKDKSAHLPVRSYTHINLYQMKVDADAFRLQSEVII